MTLNHTKQKWFEIFTTPKRAKDREFGRHQPPKPRPCEHTSTSKRNREQAKPATRHLAANSTPYTIPFKIIK